MKALFSRNFVLKEAIACVAAFAACVSAAAGADSLRAFDVRIFTFPETAFVRAYAVETRNEIIVIDAGFSPAHIDAIKSAAEASGKSITRVLLTHGHIDHYPGAFVLVDDPDQIVTSPGVAEHIREYDDVNYARFGATPPPGLRAPGRLLENGASFVIDGVTFTIHDAGPGESYADVWWTVEADKHTAAFLGDLAMYGLPPFMQSGHSADWINTLRDLKETLPQGAELYIGHDAATPAEARGLGILDWQIERLEEFRDAVWRRTRGARLLSGDEITAVTADLNAAAPENIPAFNFLIASSANVLAAELVLETERLALEERLQSVLSDRRQR